MTLTERCPRIGIPPGRGGSGDELTGVSGHVVGCGRAGGAGGGFVAVGVGGDGGGFIAVGVSGDGGGFVAVGVGGDGGGFVAVGVGADGGSGGADGAGGDGLIAVRGGLFSSGFFPASSFLLALSSFLAARLPFCFGPAPCACAFG